MNNHSATHATATCPVSQPLRQRHSAPAAPATMQHCTPLTRETTSTRFWRQISVHLRLQLRKAWESSREARVAGGVPSTSSRCGRAVHEVAVSPPARAALRWAPPRLGRSCPLARRSPAILGFRFRLVDDTRTACHACDAGYQWAARIRARVHVHAPPHSPASKRGWCCHVSAAGASMSRPLFPLVACGGKGIECC